MSPTDVRAIVLLPVAESGAGSATVIPAVRGPSRRALLLGVALAATGTSVAAQAQPLPAPTDYPRQPITLISPFLAGGGNDGVARLLAQELARVTGQSVVVDNRAGAGGNVGTAAGARARPDGYTFVLSQNSVMAVNPALYRRLPFDPVKDFAPISQITAAPLVLVVPAGSRFSSVADYLRAARERPDTLTFASPGNGTLSHLLGTMLGQKSGVSLVHVPYKGASAAITDLLGGTVDLLVTSPPSVESLIASGKLRALALTQASDLGVFKGVPTLAQQGFAGLETTGWYGVFAPAGTPADRVQYLARAIRAALAVPAVVARIQQDGAQVVGGTPEQLAATLGREIPRWAAVVKAAHLQLD